MGRATNSRPICVGAAIAAATFVACLDFGELSGGDSGASMDASTDAPSSDASTGDGNNPSDAGSTSDADAGTVFAPFVSCAKFSPAPALCNDFDEGSITGTAFSSMAGTLSLDGTSFVSGTHSLLAQYQGNDSFVQRDVLDASFPSSQHFSFQFFPGGPSVSAPASAIVASWYAGDGSSDNGGCSVALKWTTAKATIETVHYPGAVVSESDLTVQPAAGQWSRVDMTLTDDGTTVTLAAFVNGANAGSTPTDCGSIKGLPQLIDVGVTTGSTGAFRFDNVEFDGK